MPPKKYDPCKLTACKIQKCLRENHYQESACWEVLEEMRQCCIRHKNEESLCCDGIDLEREFTADNTGTKGKATRLSNVDRPS